MAAKPIDRRINQLTPERYHQVKRVFTEACQRNEADRAAYLDQACADDPDLRREVESLFYHDDQSLPLRLIISAAAAMGLAEPDDDDGGPSLGAEDSTTEDLPKQIGRFRILRVRGRGGMGVIYEAQQDHPRRRIALKVIRPGLASRQLLQRFRFEAQMLGRLQHPGIAQIYEASTAQVTSPQGHTIEQPYFAMEYVEGVQLDEYLEREDPDLRKRLNLFASICDAVQHAHQMGVIHRDLKPGNILVDRSGQPKVVDFGVARVTDVDAQVTTMQTHVGQLIGTLPYMSPEQLRGDSSDLDTRSDVYALGAICYQMLTGRLPLQLENRTIPEAVRIATEQEPSPLRTVDRRLAGDLDTIVSKALEKDRNRRYAAASDLAADIRRYLSDEPITARPVTTIYQLRKFARRNRVLVCGLAATFVALVIGVMGTSLGLAQAVRARDAETRQREIAQEQRAIAEENEASARTAAARSEQVATLLKDMLKGVGPAVARGRDTTLLREILDRTAERIGTELKNQPEVEAELRDAIGMTYESLGLYDHAESMLRRAVELRRSVLGSENPHTATSLGHLGLVLKAQGRLSEAEPFYLQALAIDREVYGNDHARVATDLANLGLLLQGQGRLAEAEPLCREALAIDRAVYGDEHPAVATDLNNLAILLQAQGDLSEAEALLRRALAIDRAVYQEPHPEIATDLDNLGHLLEARGQYAEAESVSREALAMYRRLLGDAHPDLARSINNLASVLNALGKAAEAESLYRQALALRKKLLGDEHPAVAQSLNNLAVLLKEQGKLSEAESLCREALGVYRKSLGDRHPDVASSLNSLGFIVAAQGRLTEAESLYRESLRLSEELLGANHADVATKLNNLAHVMTKQGRHREAEPLYHRALEIRRKQLGDEHPGTLVTMNNLAEVYKQLDRYDRAETMLAGVVDAARRSLPEGHWHVGVFLANHGRCLTKLERYAEAEAALLEARVIMEAARGANDPRTIKVIESAVELYDAWGKPEEASRVRAMLTSGTTE